MLCQALHGLGCVWRAVNNAPGQSPSSHLLQAPTSKTPQARGKGWVLPDATADVSTLYKFGKELGAGQFGITHLAVEKSSGKTLAIKSISKRKMVSFDDQEDVRREVQIMHHLAGEPELHWK
jgi:calcium-dependent protein kinase